MDKLKKFFKYFVCFLIVYVLVDVLSFQIIKSTYIDRNFTTDFSSPKIEITRCQSTITNGVVEGILTNDTGSVIKDKLLKLDFFTKRGTNVGTKYVDLGEIQNGDKFNFQSLFNFDDVDSVKASLVDKSSIPDLGSLDFSLDDLRLDRIDPFVAFFAIVLAFNL